MCWHHPVAARAACGRWRSMRRSTKCWSRSSRRCTAPSRGLASTSGSSTSTPSAARLPLPGSPRGTEGSAVRALGGAAPRARRRLGRRSGGRRASRRGRNPFVPRLLGRAAACSTRCSARQTPQPPPLPLSLSLSLRRGRPGAGSGLCDVVAETDDGALGESSAWGGGSGGARSTAEEWLARGAYFLNEAERQESKRGFYESAATCFKQARRPRPAASREEAPLVCAPLTL